MTYILIALALSLNSSKIIGSSFDTPAVIHACNANEFGRSDLEAGDLKNFSLYLRSKTADKYTYFLWYYVFNPAIVDYYAAQADAGRLKLLPERSPIDGNLFAATFDPDLLAPKAFFIELLRYIIAKSDYLVIPEQLDAYKKMWPSPIVTYRNEIATILNSTEAAPEYLVWAVIEEEPTRVLVLKRREGIESDEKLEPFPRTWGTSSQVVGRQFRGAFVVPRRSRSEIEVDAAPELLYTDGNYNVACASRRLLPRRFRRN